MSKNLYIDASHPNETRVVLKSKDNIEDYEYEGSKNNLIKWTIGVSYVNKRQRSFSREGGKLCRLPWSLG